jgi:hypothetical protein
MATEQDKPTAPKAEQPEVDDTATSNTTTPNVDDGKKAKKQDKPTAPKAESVQSFWVEGFGVMNAKSQKEAEQKAKKILADRRK